MKTLEVDEGFITHMSNAMCMSFFLSFFKYGHINKEMDDFNKDHNTEHMVNVANYTMIRYMFPQANESYNPAHNNKEQSVTDWLYEDLLNNK